VTKH